MQRHAQGEQVDADVADQVEQENQGRGVPRGPVETALQILGNGDDPGEINDRQPAEHPQGHPEPVVQVALRGREPVAIGCFGVFDEAVRADGGGHAGHANQPPGKLLAREEEILCGAHVTAEVAAEEQDYNEVGDDQEVVKGCANCRVHVRLLDESANSQRPGVLSQDKGCSRNDAVASPGDEATGSGLPGLVCHSCLRLKVWAGRTA